MAENFNQPKADDAVLGGQFLPPLDGVVLGGLPGVKQRLAKGTIEQKIDALLDAFQYGEAGLDAVIQTLHDRANQISYAAYLLLEDRPELKVRQALQNYNTFARFECLYTFDEYEYIEYLAITSNGKTLVCHRYDTRYGYDVDSAIVWNLQTGELIRTFSLWGNRNNYCRVAVSPDGQTLVTNFQDLIQIWNVQAGEVIHSFGWDFPASIAITPDGKTLLCGALSRGNDLVDITVINLQTGQEIYTLRGHRGNIKDLIISPDGQILLSQSDRRFDFHQLWNLQTGKLIRTFEIPQTWIANSLGITPEERTLVSSIRDGRIEVWDLHSNEIICSFAGNSPSVMSPDGKIIVCSSADNSIEVWDVQLGKELCSLQGHFSKIEHIALSVDKQFIASYSADGTIKIWGLP